MAVMEPWDLKETPAATEPSALRDHKVRREILVDHRDRKALPATMACRGLKETKVPKARPAR